MNIFSPNDIPAEQPKPASLFKFVFRNPFFMRVVLVALIPAALVWVSGCTQPKAAAASSAANAPTVGVITLVPRMVILSKEFSGRTSPYRIAEVRARVSGIVIKRLFVEGSVVLEGQVLFEIDGAPYVAALSSAKAILARAEANLASARAQAGRNQSLIESNAISRQDYDDSQATLMANQADVAAGRAAVETATIALGYTAVTSPLSGRIGRSAVTEGAFVQQGQATLLATVQQLDPIYVDVKQSSAEWLRLRDEIALGRLQGAGGETDVGLVTDNNREYASPGRLQFSDITVDPSTGSITLRVLFPNPQEDLLPGMFVRARIIEGVNQHALLVPQTAVSRNQRGDATTLIVDTKGKAELRTITAIQSVGNAWLISAGLVGGDRVIIEGQQRVRPGMAVNAVGLSATAAVIFKPLVISTAGLDPR